MIAVYNEMEILTTWVLNCTSADCNIMQQDIEMLKTCFSVVNSCPMNCSYLGLGLLMYYKDYKSQDIDLSILALWPATSCELPL